MAPPSIPTSGAGVTTAVSASPRGADGPGVRRRISNSRGLTSATIWITVVGLAGSLLSISNGPETAVTRRGSRKIDNVLAAAGVSEKGGAGWTFQAPGVPILGR